MTALSPKYGRALRTRLAIQSAFNTYAAGPWFGVKTYKRGDPGSPDLSDDPVLGVALHNNRDATAPFVGMPKGDAQRVVPLALAEIGLWLTACFGLPVTTGATGNFSHVFQSGAEELPSLSVEDLLYGSVYRRHRGVVVDGFAIQGVKENAYPQVTLDLLMRDAAAAGAALAGEDADALAFERPSAWRVKTLWNDVAIGECVTSNFSYKNNCERWLGQSGDEFPVQIDPGMSAVTGALKLRTVSETYHALAANGGAPGKLTLVWTLASAPTTRLFQIDANAVRLSVSGQPVEGGGEITSDFTFRGEQGVAAAVTVTLKNSVETYEPDED